MDKQEVFNKVAKHLLKQNEKSLDRTGGTCLYRGPDGKSCAVGCLIADEHYPPGIEGRGALETAVLEALGRSGVVVSDGEADLLTDLQDMHDSTEPYEWRQLLSEIANRYSLTMPEVP